MRVLLFAGVTGTPRPLVVLLVLGVGTTAGGGAMSSSDDMDTAAVSLDERLVIRGVMGVAGAAVAADFSSSLFREGRARFV